MITIRSKTIMKRFALTLLACSALSACSSGFFDSDDETRLEGERISVLELQKTLEPDSNALDGASITLPGTWENEYWPQSGGYPNHAMQHLALGESPLGELWSTSIGEGASDEIPLTAQPIVVDGKVFTLDTESRLSAFDAQTGKRLWQKSVRDQKEDEAVIGGGIGFSGNALYVTAGYNELLAASPENGEIYWRKDMPAAVRAAPTIMDGRVFILTMDNRLLAIDAMNGSTLWDYIGLSESAGLVGAASPATNRDIVVPGFSSGEITALRVENGSVTWSDNIASVRSMGGLDSLSDIKALPVIDKGIVFAISFGGRIVAIDERTGTRIWQREIGGAQTPWVAGDYVFVISSDNDLISLNRDTGAIAWIKELPRYIDPEDRDGKIIWSGPIMAGGRLIVTGTHGHIIEINPQDGEAIKELNLRTSISLPPIVAGNTLYVLDDNGILTAWQ